MKKILIGSILLAGILSSLMEAKVIQLYKWSCDVYINGQEVAKNVKITAESKSDAKEEIMKKLKEYEDKGYKIEINCYSGW